MNFPFNFIIIPGIIIAVAVIGNKYIKRGFADSSWYKSLKKPQWVPSGRLIGEIWTFIYVITGLAILWYWNVPAAHWFRYVTAVILLANAYLNANWKKTLFVDHNLHKGYREVQLLTGTAILATILMFFASPIASFLMLPYIAWLWGATKFNKEILEHNKEKSPEK